jgi:resuscitation-promoting factor RpfB
VGPIRRRLLTDTATLTRDRHRLRRERLVPLAVGLLGVALALTGCGGSHPSRLADVEPAATSVPVAAGRATPASATASSAPASATSAPATSAPAASALPVAAPSSSVELRTETVTKTIKFRTVTRKDPDLDRGDTRTVRQGVKGLLELTFRVSYTDGEETGRELASKRTVRKPVDRLVAVGTRDPEPAGGDCDPNYSGACVPIDSDVDCAGGSGNGPSYVDGPVRVVGDDIYGLDRDGDGIGCD